MEDLVYGVIRIREEFCIKWPTTFICSLGTFQTPQTTTFHNMVLIIDDTTHVRSKKSIQQGSDVFIFEANRCTVRFGRLFDNVDLECCLTAC